MLKKWLVCVRVLSYRLTCNKLSLAIGGGLSIMNKSLEIPEVGRKHEI